MENAIASEKFESRHFILSPSPGNTLPGSYYHLPGKRKLLIARKQCFFKNLDTAEERRDYGQALLDYEEVFIEGSDGL